MDAGYGFNAEEIQSLKSTIREAVLSHALDEDQVLRGSRGCDGDTVSLVPQGPWRTILNRFPDDKEVLGVLWQHSFRSRKVPDTMDGGGTESFRPKGCAVSFCLWLSWSSLTLPLCSYRTLRERLADRCPLT